MSFRPAVCLFRRVYAGWFCSALRTGGQRKAFALLVKSPAFRAAARVGDRPCAGRDSVFCIGHGAPPFSVVSAYQCTGRRRCRQGRKVFQPMLRRGQPFWWQQYPGNGCRAQRTAAWPVFEQQLFDLHAGKDIDVVERLVPDIQMCRLAQAFGQQHLLFLAGAVIGHILAELHPFKTSLRRMARNSGRRAGFPQLNARAARTGGRHPAGT